MHPSETSPMKSNVRMVPGCGNADMGTVVTIYDSSMRSKPQLGLCPSGMISICHTSLAFVAWLKTSRSQLSPLANDCELVGGSDCQNSRPVDGKACGSFSLHSFLLVKSGTVHCPT